MFVYTLIIGNCIFGGMDREAIIATCVLLGAGTLGLTIVQQAEDRALKTPESGGRSEPLRMGHTEEAKERARIWVTAHYTGPETYMVDTGNGPETYM